MGCSAPAEDGTVLDDAGLGGGTRDTTVWPTEDTGAPEEDTAPPPDAWQPDTAPKPDTAPPPDSWSPDTSKPDTAPLPDSWSPDVSKADTAVTDAKPDVKVITDAPTDADAADGWHPTK